jgi:HSP20 family protein
MSLLTSFDPFFRDLDRFTDGSIGRRVQTPRMMRVDAFRSGDHFTVNFDMPGVDPASVEVTVEKNVLSVAAERHWTPEEGDQVVIAERPQGRFERKLYLSDNLNTGGIEAHYDRGVLSLHIPVSEASKPRKVQVTAGDRSEAIAAAPSQN